jgi:hypothetical protein
VIKMWTWRVLEAPMTYPGVRDMIGVMLEAAQGDIKDSRRE